MPISLLIGPPRCRLDALTDSKDPAIDSMATESLGDSTAGVLPRIFVSESMPVMSSNSFKVKNKNKAKNSRKTFRRNSVGSESAPFTRPRSGSMPRSRSGLGRGFGKQIKGGTSALNAADPTPTVDSDNLFVHPMSAAPSTEVYVSTEGMAVDTNSHDGICRGIIDSPIPQLPSSPSGLRKTQSMGKMTEKKGIAARLRRLRRGQDPRTSIAEQYGVTSGESDSEAITDDAMWNRVGELAQKLSGSLPSSLKARRAAAFFTDLTLSPPPQLVRANTYHNPEIPTRTPPTSATSHGARALSMQHSTPIKSSVNEMSMTSEPGGGKEASPSSTARFKEMIKRNVGLSTFNTNSTPNSPPPPSIIPSSAVSSPSAKVHNGSLSPSWSPTGDSFRDEQQRQQQSSPSTPRLSLSRFASRRKKIRNALLGGNSQPLASDSEIDCDDSSVAACSDGESEGATVVLAVRDDPHSLHFRTFLPYLFRYHHRFHLHLHESFKNAGIRITGHSTSEDDSRDESKDRPQEERQKQQVSTSGISQALEEARQLSQDPDVLLVELEPLPADFVSAFVALRAQQEQTQPSISARSPSLTIPSLLPVPSATSTSGGGNSTAGSVVAAAIGAATAVPLGLAPVKSSTQHSPLSATMASVGLRSLTISNTNQGGSSKPSIQAPATSSLTTSATFPYARSKATTSTTALVPVPTPAHTGEAEATATSPNKDDTSLLNPRAFLFKSYQHARFQCHYMFRVHEDSVQYAKLPVELEEACSQYFRKADVTYRALESKAKAWRDERKAALERREQEFEEVRSSLSLTMMAHPHPSFAPVSTLMGHCSLGSNSDNSYQYTLDSLDSVHITKQEQKQDYGEDGPKPSPNTTLSPEDTQSNSTALHSPESSHHSDHGLPSNNIHLQALSNSNITLTESTSTVPMATCTAEYEKLVKIQRVIDNAYWQRVELDHWEESKQSLHGLHLYLQQLTKHVEFEVFDKVYHVDILNENRDTALFSIFNGDKTNIMWLESPSVKQKHEFLNCIEISLMSSRASLLEPENQQRQVGDKDKRGFSAMEILLGCDCSKHSHRGRHRHHHRHRRCNHGFYNMSDDDDDGDDDSHTDADILFDMSLTRVSILEDKLVVKREETQNTIRKIEDVLEKLETLDQCARKLAVSTERALDTRQIRVALQPCPGKGLTLAETVEAKIRDVNERIIVCARIMGAARFNLNRLTYELELEQRSVRLFRRYKIAIAVVLVSALGLVLF
ncbi:hypothetical protein BGX31_004301 [Mortierella sp. GBA43]|nr:hypothetical protein BGX31_004301 [Mortierella sp. GBA43]